MEEIGEQEKKILEFWKKKKIYQKLKKRNSKGKKFYFMDGPPYATGSIHMGTALNKILKDIAMRSQRLMGKDVFDRAGYDTHGLPIENKVEKKLGFDTKSEIEKYGVKKFITECKKFATEYIDVMNNEFENLGVWMDFENPYLTLENGYIESIWETFKKADEKGLLYLGKYPIHACPRCETAVAYNEIEYKKQTDTSVYVKFKLEGEKNKYLIIWTTTPWTLPSNSGVMVNPKFDYAEVETDDEIWIIAKERVENLFDKLNKGYKVRRVFKGKELKGLEYSNPLAENLNLESYEGAYKVILSERYVNLEDGTGLVHTAPGCGKEDFDAGQKAGLPVISIVGIDGVFDNQGGKYSGKKAKEVNKEIIKDLEENGSLVLKEAYSHDYPICWRCNSPLLMISVPQWFFKISEIHHKILSSNEEVNWIPKYMKLRMKAWLEGISDWPISRNRYWGTPLPIWLCDKCDNKEIIGSISELEKKSKRKVTEIHKPEIDKIQIPCKCGGKMTRVSEVLDVWFDSGVSSWAALGYPKDKKKFNKFWPADLNIEGKDQFRGWWNSQIILSEIRFGKKPFENISVHGLVLDLGKIKMSKSKGNVVSPHEIIEKYGRDYLRYYFSKVSKGEDFAFDEKVMSDIQKFFRVLINVNAFVNQVDKEKKKINVEDKWILSKYNSLIKEVEKNYNDFKFSEAVQNLEKFIVEDFSKTYIKLIRDRSEETYEVLNEIRNGILVLISPIVPFLTEKIWLELKEKRAAKSESVHMSHWPKTDNKKIDKNLDKEFGNTLMIIEKGLAERDKEKVGLRWPLNSINVASSYELNDKMKEIIRNQLNVKNINIISLDKKIAPETTIVELDTKMTPELEAEGYARELSRQVQALRKKMGLVKKDVVELSVFVEDSDTKDMFESQKNFIKQRTNSKKVEFVTTGKERFKKGTDFKIKNKRGMIKLVPTAR